MADQTTKKEEVSKPPFDPNELLTQLRGIVDKNKGAPAADGGGGAAKSWWSVLIIIAVVLAGVAVWSWLSWRSNKELAKLRHEKNKAKILKKQGEIFAKLAENDVERAEAQKGLDKAERSLLAIETTIKSEEARYEADMRAISDIRSWRDAGLR